MVIFWNPRFFLDSSSDAAKIVITVSGARKTNPAVSIGGTPSVAYEIISVFSVFYKFISVSMSVFIGHIVISIGAFDYFIL